MGRKTNKTSCFQFLVLGVVFSFCLYNTHLCKPLFHHFPPADAHARQSCALACEGSCAKDGNSRLENVRIMRLNLSL
jgi:hypothetical protein